MMNSERRPSSAYLVLAAAATLALSGCGGTSASTKGATVATSAVANGRELYETDGCIGCHSLSGIRMTGPSWRGLAGSEVHLSDGRVVKADDAYLTRHIVEPDAMTVQGYPAGVMGQAIEDLDLKVHPTDVRDLVAFIDSLR